MDPFHVRDLPRSPTPPMPNAVFLWNMCSGRPACPLGPSEARIKTALEWTEVCFWKNNTALCWASCCMFAANITAGGACKQSCLFMLKKRMIKLIEREWRSRKWSVFCSHASTEPCSISSSPCPKACIWLCYSHPGRHLWTSFFTLLLLLCDFHVLLFGDTASFLPKLFLKQKWETFHFFFCQRAFSSWRRSSRGKSQMMTAIVKGQISPCGFASDCMFISFWSSEDSKPLSRSPHSLNGWSSACHWNRLRADPGDMGKVAVCHPTWRRQVWLCLLFIKPLL